MTILRRLLVAIALLSLAFSIAAAADKKQKEGQEPAGDNQMTLKACGSKESEVDFSASTDKTTHPTPEAPDGSAMVYVLRPTMIGNKVQTKLAVDGVWKGVNRGKNYFFFPLEPGEHHFRSKAENRSTLTLNVEAGKTYFLQQHVLLGVMKARNSIEVMKDDEAKKKLQDCHPSVWTTK